MRTHLALNKDALTSPDVLRAPREGRAAALLRNVMNSRRLIAAPEALDTASSTRTSTLEGPGTTPADVRFGSKADMCNAKRDVRFTPESGHVQCNSACPLSANSGHRPPIQSPRRLG